jgi:protein disulfide-isomerase A1
MKYAFGLAALAALATASDVHDLTKDTFDGFVKENDLVLAECESQSYHYHHDNRQC